MLISMTKPPSNLDFLFDLVAQAGKEPKSTIFVHFQSLTNSRNYFENCQQKLKMQVRLCKFCANFDLGKFRLNTNDLLMFVNPNVTYFHYANLNFDWFIGFGTPIP